MCLRLSSLISMMLLLLLTTLTYATSIQSACTKANHCQSIKAGTVDGTFIFVCENGKQSVLYAPLKRHDEYSHILHKSRPKPFSWKINAGRVDTNQPGTGNFWSTTDHIPHDTAFDAIKAYCMQGMQNAKPNASDKPP